MTSNWTLLCNTVDGKKVNRIVELFLERIERQCSNRKSWPGSNPGELRLQLSVELKSTLWREAVVEMIELAQTVGGSWAIAGPASDDFILVTSRGIRVPGILFIECEIQNSLANPEANVT